MNSFSSLPRERMYRTTLRTALLAVLLLIAAAPVCMAAEQVKAAVVLGHYPQGARTPTAMQNARCLEAYSLYKKGLIEKIVVTGGYTRAHISEARMMKIALAAYGVPAEDIVEEQLASTTVENAFYTARLFDELGWEKKAVLVSQEGHLWRAKANFRDQGFKIFKTIPAPVNPGPAVFDTLPEDSGVPPLPENAPRLAVVFEPFDSKSPLTAPHPALARRLRLAASLIRNGRIDTVAVYSDWYTRGPVDIAETMHVALAALGVPQDKILLKSRLHYGKLARVEKFFDGEPLLLIGPTSIDERAESLEGVVPWLF